MNPDGQQPDETDQEHSERMHRDNAPPTYGDPEFDEDHDPIFEEWGFDEGEWNEDCEDG